MYRRTEVYICDSCGCIELPRSTIDGDELPKGWVQRGGAHKCPLCANIHIDIGLDPICYFEAESEKRRGFNDQSV